MSTLASPCVSVCRMDPLRQLCEGCLRTLDEIAAWGTLSEAGRLQVWSAIEQRRARNAKPDQLGEAVDNAQPNQTSESQVRLCEAPTHPQWPNPLRFIQRDWLSCNSVLVLDEQQGATLFDSGYVKHAHHTREQLQRLLAGMPLRRLINTHLHSDHCGANALLQQSLGCEVFIPAASWQAVCDWDEEALSYRATGQRCERFRADAAIKPGDTIETGTLCWQAQSAPGHDPESLIFFEAKQGLLISADVLWADGFGVIFPELEGESGFEEQAAMLDLIEYLQPRWVFPGHGPAFSDVDQALSSARKRLAAMRVNPAKHAGHALKVLLKFLMLDLEWTHKDALKTHLAQAKLLAACAQRMQMQADEALQWAIDALLAQGHLRAEGPMLRNH